jgi:hypothetical protein
VNKLPEWLGEKKHLDRADMTPYLAKIHSFTEDPEQNLKYVNKK